MNAASSDDRMLAFELAGALYALPIADVAEVTEVPPVATVPLLPRRVGGVVNHHGDALLVVYGNALLEIEGSREPEHLLVLARDLDDPDRYGLPVDRIHGLVLGRTAPAAGPGVVVERRPLDGRLMNVLDARRLLQRAASVVEQSMTENVPIHGGES